MEENSNLVIDYEYVRDLLKLEECEAVADRLLLASAQETAECYMDRRLHLQSYLCIQEVRGGRVVLEELNPVRVTAVRDVRTRRNVQGSFSVQENVIDFADASLERRELYIAYDAGYTAETLPAALKESLILLFLHKNELVRRTYRGDLSVDEYSHLVATSMPNDVRGLLEPYRRKRW